MDFLLICFTLCNVYKYAKSDEYCVFILMKTEATNGTFFLESLQKHSNVRTICKQLKKAHEFVIVSRENEIFFQVLLKDVILEGK